jgi:hypothetical protein
MMGSSRARRAAIGAVAAVLIGVLGVPQGASASTGELVPEPRIAAVMAEVPGGVLLDENHAVWPELGMALETPSGVSTRTIGGCTTGNVCVFDGYGAQGAKLSWSSCGNPTVSAFTVRSIANDRPTGYAQARSGTTVHATAYAGSYANVYGAVNNVRCVS